MNPKKVSTCSIVAALNMEQAEALVASAEILFDFVLLEGLTSGANEFNSILLSKIVYSSCLLRASKVNYKVGA